MELVLDFGNSWGKWFNPVTDQFGNFRHAIAELSEVDWRRYVGRVGNSPEGYLRVNGIPYAVGDSARRHRITERPLGASRYVETYYGVGLCYALLKGISKSARITLYASHAPGDIDYTPDLKASARRTWNVEANGDLYTFVVRDVETFDEPLGGFNHFVLTKDGGVIKRNPIANETVLICDVGGHTVDVGAIDPGGVIDVASFTSTRTGVIKVIEDFTSELRGNHRLLFKDTKDVDPRRIDEAIRTGSFKGGNVKIDCSAEADAACYALVNDVCQIINAAGGVMNFDKILLTGGGSALIHQRLTESVPSIDFIAVEQDRNLMQYANVFGGAKLFRMLKKMGVL